MASRLQYLGLLLQSLGHQMCFIYYSFDIICFGNLFIAAACTSIFYSFCDGLSQCCGSAAQQLLFQYFLLLKYLLLE